MDHRLLEIIACPVCNGKLYYSRDKQELICKLDNWRSRCVTVFRSCWKMKPVHWWQKRSNHEFCCHYPCALCFNAPAVNRWWISMANR